FNTFVGNIINQGKTILKKALTDPVGATVDVGKSVVSASVATTDWTGNAIKSFFNFFDPSPRYSGNIPNAANGLFNAASTESSRMPLGANLVMANDKEFILAPARRPVSSAVSSGNGGGGNVVNHAGNSFVININGAVGDMKVIADEVINAIQSRIDNELMAQL
ncbi:MAG: hypothetical protein PUP93_29030, partial [Rhizonema sp. NSF051]|nr:hypothetical protein [Rhizonema sp. NSF051]